MVLLFRILERKKNMTGANDSLLASWRPRWYYVLKNKTTGKHYFGQTLRKDMSNYLGSGTYWKPHCCKNGGYDKNNIEIIHKWWISDIELAELLILEFESKYPSYWLSCNNQWANLIPENTEDAPNFTFLSTESRKIAIENRVSTLSRSDETGVTGFERIGQKISKSRRKILDNGLTVGKLSAISTSRTKSDTINGDGLNIHQQIGKKAKETKDIIGDDGLNMHQRVGRALAQKKYTQIDDSGLNAHQRIGKVVSQTKKSDKWRSTIGLEATKKLKASLCKIEDNGKTIAQNRAVKAGQTQTSEEWKNKNYLQCVHCQVLCNPGNHNRWHGEKCRHKQNCS